MVLVELGYISVLHPVHALVLLVLKLLLEHQSVVQHIHHLAESDDLVCFVSLLPLLFHDLLFLWCLGRRVFGSVPVAKARPQIHGQPLGSWLLNDQFVHELVESILLVEGKHVGDELASTLFPLGSLQDGLDVLLRGKHS